MVQSLLLRRYSRDPAHIKAAWKLCPKLPIKKRHGDERGTVQYELVFWLREQGFLFCDDFIWGKPSPPPGRFNRFLKDAVEYCFHFAKSPQWQFFPEQCLTPARWTPRIKSRRKRLAHNYVRAQFPVRAGVKRVQAGPKYGSPLDAS